MRELNYLFKYLKTENINIDKEEFIFQMESHPDYPSLLSISDTLTFFNINNIASKISKEEINFLHPKYITLLNVELKEPALFLVEKNNEKKYTLYADKKEKINEVELMNRWKDVVLIIDNKEDNTVSKKKTDPKLILILTFLSIILIYKGLSKILCKRQTTGFRFYT